MIATPLKGTFPVKGNCDFLKRWSEALFTKDRQIASEGRQKDRKIFYSEKQNTSKDLFKNRFKIN